MHDDIGQRIDSQLGAEEVRDPDLNWVVARGRRLRTLRRAAVGVGTAAVIAAGSVAVLALPTDGPLPAPVVGDETPPVDDGGMVEDMTEQERAEVFAFRALAHTGLMQPYAPRTYLWTYADDTTQTYQGWRVGFAASDCEPRDGSFTCRGLSGEDPEDGNAVTDNFVMVRDAGDRWVVAGIDGNMLPEERERILGYSLPKQEEPSHWDFAAVGIWPQDNGEYMISMIPIWVGPYPTSAPGSMCETFIVLASGEVRSVPNGRFYEDAPNRPFERGGWIRGTGFVSDEEVERAEVHCHQTPPPEESFSPRPRLEPPKGPRQLIANGTFEGPEWGGLEGDGWWLYGWQLEGFRCWAFNVTDPDGRGGSCTPLRELMVGTEYIGASMGIPARDGAQRSILAGELHEEVAYIEIELSNERTYRVNAIVPDPSLGIDAHYFVAFVEPSESYSVTAYAEDGSVLQRRNYDD